MGLSGMRGDDAGEHEVEELEDEAADQKEEDEK